MSAHLSALLILSGLSGIQGLTSVSKVSMRAGGSISVPCLYESKYTNHVKYLCWGYYWNHCSIVVRSTTTSRSGGFSISDDKQEKIFTVSITKPAGTYYCWCGVEINNGKDIGAFFELLVTKDQAPLSVDQQEVRGFTGESVSILFRHSNKHTIQWCRLGRTCVKKSTGELDGLRVNIDSNFTTTTVTLSGLKTQSSGWYFLSRGDQKMPVYITVKDRPTTTTTKTTTCLKTSASTSQPASVTTVDPKNTTVQIEQPRTSSFKQTLIILLSLLFVILMLVIILWIIWRRRQQTKTQSSASAETEEGITYSTVSHSRQRNKKAEEGVTYSTVSHARQAGKKAEEGVTYSTVSHSKQKDRKAKEEVIYSTVLQSGQAKRQPGPKQEEDVTYSTINVH